MNDNSLKLLEYDKVKEKLGEYTVSAIGRELVNKLAPSGEPGIIRIWLDETT